MTNRSEAALLAAGLAVNWGCVLAAAFALSYFAF